MPCSRSSATRSKRQASQELPVSGRSDRPFSFVAPPGRTAPVGSRRRPSRPSNRAGEFPPTAVRAPGEGSSPISWWFPAQNSAVGRRRELSRARTRTGGGSATEVVWPRDRSRRSPRGVVSGPDRSHRAPGEWSRASHGCLPRWRRRARGQNNQPPVREATVRARGQPFPESDLTSTAIAGAFSNNRGHRSRTVAAPRAPDQRGIWGAKSQARLCAARDGATGGCGQEQCPGASPPATFCRPCRSARSWSR